MKKMMALFLVGMVLAAGPVFAEKGKQSEKAGLEEKFCSKAEMIKKYGADAGMTQEQIQKVKDLKYETRKALIGTDAQIELLKLDIWKELYAETPDLKAIDFLIDQKYDLKRARAKRLVAAYVMVKSLPTAEQWKALKASKHKKD